jgi:competence protein ComEC
VTLARAPALPDGADDTLGPWAQESPEDEVPPATTAEALGLLGLLAPAALVSGRVTAWLYDLGLGPVLRPGVTVTALGLLVAAVLLLAAGRPRSASVVVLLATVVVVAAGVLLRLDTFERGMLPGLIDRGGTVTLDARVAAEPRRGELGWQTVLRISAIDGVATSERAAAVLDEAPALGTPLRLVASARPLPEGGYGRWLAQAHAVALLDVRDIQVMGDAGRVSRASEFVRDRVRVAATRHLGQGTGGLLVGFVTGDTRLLPETDVNAMQATGLSHLTAVSGSNTAILLAGISGLLTLARVGARLRWTVLAAAVPWFAFITRLEPSVLRAGTMALLVIATAVLGVARDARHLLAGAVLLLVLIDPMLSWSLGLLLSAGATLGVLVIAPRIAAGLESILPRAIAALLGITLGAQLAVAPVLIAGFGTIEWVSIPANMLAVPVAAIGSTLAFIGSALALVHVGMASSVFALAGPASAFVLAIARVGERFTGGPEVPDVAGFRLAVGAAMVLAGTSILAVLRRSGPRT